MNERRRAGELGPASHCLPHTIVDYFLVPAPFKFVHTPGLTIMLFEEFNHFRQVFTDGRPFPDDMQPAWFGYSVGKWDGDAFVVETAGFNNRGWLDVGTPLTASEALRTTERFLRPNVGSLQVQVTIADPITFSRTWKTQTIWFRLMPDTDFIEHICENEKDFAAHHLVNRRWAGISGTNVGLLRPDSRRQRRLRASSSSRVRGQSDPSRRDKLRSARIFPPVWQRAQ